MIYYLRNYFCKRVAKEIILKNERGCMKKINFLILFGFVFFAALTAFAQELKLEAPEGMEYRRYGDFDVLVPKDLEQRQAEGSWTVMEGPTMYTGRKLQDIEGRIASLEASNKQLLAEVKEIKESMDALKKRLGLKE